MELRKGTKHDELLKLNLQFFAEDNGGDGAEESTEEPTGDHPDNKQTSAEDEGAAQGATDEQEAKSGEGEEKKFTQAELNAILQDRLDRDRKAQERKQDEENGQYKKLYEDMKQETLNAKKESLLAKAGYDESQVERYKKYLDGESDDELKEALDALKEDIPPKSAQKTYGDPNPGNNAKTPPKKTNLEDKGKSAYQRLKEKGKIRGNSNK